MTPSTTRNPWSYAPTKRQAQAWALFGEDKFPHYELFWQAFVEPRTRRAWHLAFLPGTPPLDQKLARLNQRVFGSLYRVHKGLIRDRRTVLQERRNFASSLRGLSLICENVELFLLILLLATQVLDEQHPVHRNYVQRLADHKAKVQAARAPFEGRLLSLDEFPPRIPFTPMLASELAAIQEHFDLDSYNALAERIRHYTEAVSSLYSLSPKYWLPRYDRPMSSEVIARDKAEEEAAIQADTAALQTILGNYPTMQDLVAEHTDRLTAEIDHIWSQQVLPLVVKQAAILETSPQI